jgi:amino acid transporter
MDIGWARFLVIMLVAAMVTLALGSIDRRARPGQRGWRELRPGASYAFAIIGGTLFTLFLSYIWLFVGSARPDAESQMQILFWLILAFGIGTTITLIQYRAARRIAICWRGDILCWRDRSGVEQRRNLDDIVAIRRALMGAVHVLFEDGAELRIDPHVRHALALIDEIDDRLEPHATQM